MGHAFGAPLRSQLSPIGRRIAVVGHVSSGKTTLARRLGVLLGLPVVELDALFWRPEWNETPSKEFAEQVSGALSGNGWIADGHYQRAWSTIWPRADSVIWLDLPLPLILTRILLRSWRRWWSRESLWGTNTDDFWRQLKVWDASKSLLAWAAVSHNARRRQYVSATIDPRWAHIRFVRLRSTLEIEQFGDGLEYWVTGSSSPAK